MTVKLLVSSFIRRRQDALHRLLSFVLGDWLDNQVSNGVLQPPPVFSAHDQLANPESEAVESPQRLSVWAFTAVCLLAADWLQSYPERLTREAVVALQALLNEVAKDDSEWLQNRPEKSADEPRQIGIREQRRAWNIFCEATDVWLARGRLPAEEAAQPQLQQASTFPAQEEPSESLHRSQLAHIWDSQLDRLMSEVRCQTLVSLGRLTGQQVSDDSPAWQLANCLTETSEKDLEHRMTEAILPDLKLGLSRGNSSGALAAMYLEEIVREIADMSSSHKLDHVLAVLRKQGFPEHWRRSMSGQMAASGVSASPAAGELPSAAPLVSPSTAAQQQQKEEQQESESWIA